jgi:hypothetical protein
MASRQSTVDFIIDQILEAGDVSARKMFGEYGLYCGGKMVALVCDDQLFVKPTVGGRSLLKTVTEASPYRLLFSQSPYQTGRAERMIGVVVFSPSEIEQPSNGSVRIAGYWTRSTTP